MSQTADPAEVIRILRGHLSFCNDQHPINKTLLEQQLNRLDAWYTEQCQRETFELDKQVAFELAKAAIDSPKRYIGLVIDAGDSDLEDYEASKWSPIETPCDANDSDAEAYADGTGHYKYVERTDPAPLEFERLKALNIFDGTSSDGLPAIEEIDFVPAVYKIYVDGYA